METPQPGPQQTRFEKWKEEQRAVRFAVQERMSAAIIGAFGLIAGLAWNDAVRSAIEHFYPPGEGISAKFMYAVVITIVVAIFIYIITKWLVPKKPEEKK